MLGKRYKPNINLEKQAISFKRCSLNLKVSGGYVEEGCQTEFKKYLY